jgi:hypothetical protein|tara:strand:- start:2357 stop:3094 length:738 start_codon:yes stop_codon:yes gene_type:complete
MNAILLQLMNERYVVVSLSSIVYIVPQGKGSAIKTTHGDLGVLESPEAIYELWHGSCTNSTNSTNSTNIVEPKNTTPITTNTNSSNSKNISAGVVGDGKVLILNNNPIPVDPSTKPQLFDYCLTNEQLLNLLSYWMKLYEKHGGQLTMVSAIDLGTLSKVVRTGAIDKAMAVFDWVFTSDHYRAVYLRNKGMVNPAVVVSSKKLDANYALSQQQPLPPLPKSVQRPSMAIPTFDKDGNIIGGNNG